MRARTHRWPQRCLCLLRLQAAELQQMLVASRSPKGCQSRRNPTKRRSHSSSLHASRTDVKFLIQPGIEIPGLEKYRLHYDIKTESAAALAKHVDF